MTWQQIMNLIGPLASQSVAGIAFVICWTVRIQFKKIEDKQKKNTILLQRLLKIHCIKYPTDTYELLSPIDTNGKSK